MYDYEIQVPISRFRRELNTWIRFIGKNPESSIILTRNTIAVAAVVSPSWYEKRIPTTNIE